MAARRLAFSLANDSAQALKSETKRYSRTSARQRLLLATEDLGQVFGRPGEMGQPESPLFIQGQQVLTDGFIGRPGLGAVVEEVKLTDLALAVMRFTFHENLPDERRDGVDGSRNGEKSHRRETGIRQPRSERGRRRPRLSFRRAEHRSALATKSASTSLNWPTSP